MSAKTPPIPLVRAALAQREPCSPTCPGWGVFETDRGLEIQACDECRTGAPKRCRRFLTDEAVSQLPEAGAAIFIARALADADNHGMASDPDHEVGDLRAMIVKLAAVMTPEQIAEVAASWRPWDDDSERPCDRCNGTRRVIRADVECSHRYHLEPGSAGAGAHETECETACPACAPAAGESRSEQ